MYIKVNTQSEMEDKKQQTKKNLNPSIEYDKE